MDVLQKIEDIRKSYPTLDELTNEKLRIIEARYAFSSSLSNFQISVDPSVMEELDEIISSQSKTLNEQEPIISKTSNSQYIDFLKESIMKNIQSLTRLPVPQPINFNREAFNRFVSQESREIMALIKDIYNKQDLLNILKSLENKRMDFLSEPHKTIYTSHLSYFQELLGSTTIDKDDRVVLATLVNRIKAMDISCEELEFFMEKYTSPVVNIENNDIIISERDMQILNAVSDTDNKPLFVIIANILGLTNDECDVILENMLLEKQKAKNIEKLKRKLILPSVYSSLLM